MPLAHTLTAIVVGVQVALIAAFIIDPSDPPQRGSLWQALWALAHRPSFYPLAAVLLIGPPATWLAWSRPGRHRMALIAGWAAFIVVVTLCFRHRMLVMLKVLWVYGA